MSWPVLEFVKSQYLVCEDVGVLAVSITRRGNIQQQSYTNIRLRPVSATAGDDFIAPTESQIQFDQGNQTYRTPYTPIEIVSLS